jgi:hypothetical protein
VRARGGKGGELAPFARWRLLTDPAALLAQGDAALDPSSWQRNLGPTWGCESELD